MKSQSNNLRTERNQQLRKAISEENCVDMDALQILDGIVDRPLIKSKEENISETMKANNDCKVEKPVNKVVIDGCLYEEVYYPETEEAGFAFYDPTDNQFKVVPFVDDGNIRYKPIIDDFVKKKVVILPTKALPFVSTEKLLSEIRFYIHKYLDISEEDEFLCSW